MNNKIKKTKIMVFLVPLGILLSVCRYSVCNGINMQHASPSINQPISQLPSAAVISKGPIMHDSYQALAAIAKDHAQNTVEINNKLAHTAEKLRNHKQMVTEHDTKINNLKQDIQKTEQAKQDTIKELQKTDNDLKSLERGQKIINMNYIHNLQEHTRKLAQTHGVEKGINTVLPPEKAFLGKPLPLVVKKPKLMPEGPARPMTRFNKMPEAIHNNSAMHYPFEAPRPMINPVSQFKRVVPMEQMAIKPFALHNMHNNKVNNNVMRMPENKLVYPPLNNRPVSGTVPFRNNITTEKRMPFSGENSFRVSRPPQEFLNKRPMGLGEVR